MAKRNIISVLDMKDDMPELVDLAIRLKAERGHHGDPLKGKTLAMIFSKNSTRWDRTSSRSATGFSTLVWSTSSA